MKSLYVVILWLINEYKSQKQNPERGQILVKSPQSTILTPPPGRNPLDAAGAIGPKVSKNQIQNDIDNKQQKQQKNARTKNDIIFSYNNGKEHRFKV